MFLCYIDESGDEAAMRTRTDPPVLVIGGLIVEERHLKGLVWDFLALKKQYNPSLSRTGTKLSELIAFEMKGSNLRADIRSERRRRKSRAVGVIDDVLTLLEKHHVLVMAEVHVKGEGALQRYVYSHCVAQLAEQFEAQLRAADSVGMMVLDARTKVKNVPSVQRVTTSKFRAGGDPYPHLLESPVFGHSDAHVILQLADIVVSALLFPLACAGFCLCLLDNAHPSDAYLDMRERYGERLRLLEHRYLDKNGIRAGGIRVNDHMNHQPTRAIFKAVDFQLWDPEEQRGVTGALPLVR